MNETNKISNKSHYDVLVVGGSHAGLSAAMSLGRLMRSVLVVDARKPRNLASDHAHNLISMEGVDPEAWRAQAREDLKKYNTVEIIFNTVDEIQKKEELFEATLKSGELITFRKVILAYGIKDQLPAIDGIEQIWGKTAFHCPYCHGYEVRDKSVGIIDSGKIAEHIMPLMKNLTNKLVLLTQAKADLSSEFAKSLALHNIPVHHSKIVSLQREGENLESVTLEDAEVIKLDALLIGPTLPFQMNSSLGENLGCRITDLGLLEVDEVGKTSVEGVFAAGDIMNMRHSIVNAVASGQAAASSAVFELSHQDFFAH